MPAAAPDRAAIERMAKALVGPAIASKANAYAPYSNFRVGAAVLTKTGKVFTGVNVENASYGALPVAVVFDVVVFTGLTVCAERVACFKAASEGHTDIVAICCNTDITDSFKFPCGACCQVILEWNESMSVFAAKPNGEVHCCLCRHF
jgi:cytidine deaminase